MHLHILGVCGTFMGGIAAIARAAGHRVTGSDRNVYPPMSTQLEALGIERAPMLANTLISNPFGLPERRYLAGAELELALPISVLAPGQSLNITAATYDKGLQIAFLGIAAELPDIQRMADYTVDALAQLNSGVMKRRARPRAAAGPVRAERLVVQN